MRGTISGTKFNDRNNNGIRDGGLVIGSQPDVVFVIDVSSSTSSRFQGTPVGNFNGDSLSDSIIDAEIAGFIALNNDLINRGLGSTARVAVVAFESSARALDLDPLTAGIQTATTPNADRDGNGVNDVEQALRGLSVLNLTNYEAALREAIGILQSLGTTRKTETSSSCPMACLLRGAATLTKQQI